MHITMVNRRVDMRKIRDVLECIFTKELSHRATAKLLRVNRRTVTNYLERFKKSKLPWPLPAHMDNEKLENTLFLNAALPNSSDKKPIIDFPKVHTELQKKGRRWPSCIRSGKRRSRLITTSAIHSTAVCTTSLRRRCRYRCGKQRSLER